MKAKSRDSNARLFAFTDWPVAPAPRASASANTNANANARQLSTFGRQETTRRAESGALVHEPSIYSALRPHWATLPDFAQRLT
ncbi:hypothetical protein ACVFVO_10685 [Advenella kashmirensis]